MKKKRGFTLIELLVVIAIIAMLLAILMPALSKVKKIAMRVICGTNLKGLGTAQTVYANENKDNWAIANATTTTSWSIIYTNGWDNGGTALPAGPLTVGASLYMLVRNADVSPKSFVCPASDQKEFDGKNTRNYDIVQLWDFGTSITNATLTKSMGPKNCVSYSYHQPYSGEPTRLGKKSSYAVDGTRSSSFAAMADKNPWFDSKITGLCTSYPVTSTSWTDAVRRMFPYYGATPAPTSDPAVRMANSYPHGREGQNIAFADGHSAYMNTADVGVKNDNIYTQWSTADATPNKERQGSSSLDSLVNLVAVGNQPLTLQPLGTDDSFLVNDDGRTSRTAVP